MDGGDDGEWEHLVRSTSAALFRLAFLMLTDRGDAEDTVAEAFARAYPAMRRGHVVDAGAYLRRAVVNLAISRRRRFAVERAWLATVSGDSRGVRPVDEEVVDHSVLVLALRALPPRQRAAIVLRYYADLTEAQTADALGCSVGTVKAQVSRGLVRLRTALTEEASRHEL